METLEHPLLESDRPGPTDTEKFLRDHASRIDALPDKLGLRKLEHALGGVPAGPVSLALLERPTRLVPCVVDVTRNIKGAHILDQPKLMLLWWSSGFFWRANAPRERYITMACDKVMNDPAFWNRLREYGVTGGSFIDSKALTKYGGTSTSVSESDIQTLLDAWFKANNLPVDEQTIYTVMLPGGITSQYDTSNGYIGHHQTYRSTTRAGADVVYAVVEYDPDVRRMMSVITHEVYEAATNPDLKTGYYDHDKGGETEIGDMCNLQLLPGGMDGYPIHTVWSQDQCGCI
jgi:hypothetical protein